MASLGSIGGKLYRGEVSVEFVGRQRLWYTISGVILVVSAVALIVFGLNFSVDFKGGSVYQFAAGNSSIAQVRQTVSGAGGGDDAIVQKITPLGGGAAKWQVQTHPLTVKQQNAVQNAISQKFGVPDNQIAVTAIGASWGSQISQKAAEALIAFLIVIVIYLSIAFEWKMAVAALIALAHDIVITVGVYALAHFQVSPASVIGLLTILGYSLYDTVVVFDKVRENTAGLLASTRSTYSQAANQALNQTLVRSINTSLIALLPVASILFVGAGFLGAGDLKDREPQYKALAKRVQLRASGGRAAKRAAAKASATQAVPGRAATGRAGRAEGPAPEADLEPDLAADDADASVTGQPGEDAIEDTAAAAEPVAAGAGQPTSRSGPRPGPRQQPRRTSAAKRRPSGKKRRR